MIPFVTLTLHHGAPVAICPDEISWFLVRDVPSRPIFHIRKVVLDGQIHEEPDLSKPMLDEQGNQMMSEHRILTSIQVGKENFDVRDTFEEVLATLESHYNQFTELGN